MTMNETVQKEIIIELVKIMKTLKTKGLLPENVNVEETAKTIVKNLVENNIELKVEAVKSDMETRKLLGLSCIAEGNAKIGAGEKLDYTLLFKDSLEIDNKIRMQLKLIFDALKKREKDPDKIAKLEARFQELADVLEAGRLRSEHQSNFAKNILQLAIMTQEPSYHEKLLSDQRFSDYGVDPQTPGGVLKVLLYVMGDLIGRRDEATSGLNFKGQQNNPHATGIDPVLTANAAFLNLMTAVIDTQAEINLLRDFKDVIHPSPSPGINKTYL